jgi:hypothetical protein
MCNNTLMSTRKTQQRKSSYEETLAILKEALWTVHDTRDP